MTGLLATALVIAANAGGPIPSPAELARAISRFTKAEVSTGDIRQLSCRTVPQEATEVRCRWRQRHGKRWLGYAGYLAIDRTGWLLIDMPAPTIPRR